jgi:cytochrome c oxidase assembly factor CtaG
VALIAALPACAWAHTGEPLEPHDLWTAWEFDPGVVIPLALAAILYALGARRSRGIRTWEASCFWAGWVTVVIALASPVHPMGEALFSAHMTQHELLMVIAAPLLVLGRPMIPFLWGLPLRWRQRIGAATKRRPVQRAWRWLTLPAVAWIVHAIVLWGWHMPPLFQATLTSDLVHSAQHASFLFSALLFWWAVLHGREGHMGYGKSVLYIFTTAIHTSILGALLTFSPALWYPAYANTTQAWGLSPLEDQQLGGLIMWVPAGLTYVVAGLALIAGWLKESELRVLAREGERA